MKYILIVATLLLMTSCKKEIIDEGGIEINSTTYADDVFIFGHYYGECGGEQCVEIFKIEDGKLYEDTNDAYPNGTDENFEWTLLSDEKFEMVKLFPDFFPEELLSETEQVIGMPDAGDWGGYIIGKIDDGELRIWLIDTMDRNIPEYLHEYNDRIAFMTSVLQD